MIATDAARGYLGLWLWIWACLMGCAGSTQLITPTDAELAQEILPFHLATAKPPPLPKYFTHTVSRSGETYMAIARWYTGNPANWELISQANPNIDPRHLHLGLAIRIPEAILITRRPMPKPSPPKAKLPKPTPAAPPDEELFGPIETETPPASSGSDEVTPELEPLE